MKVEHCLAARIPQIPVTLECAYSGGVSEFQRVCANVELEKKDVCFYFRRMWGPSNQIVRYQGKEMA